MIDLLIRRALAFGIDLMIMAIVISAPCLYFLFSLKDCPTIFNLIFLAGVMLYFTVSEVLYSGQTLGKRLLRIRLRNIAGVSVNYYQSFGRVSLILILPEVSNLLDELLISVHILSPTEMIIPLSLWVSSFAILPISILIGSGRMGLNDFLFGTIVVRARKDFQVIDTKKIHWYPWFAIAITIIVSLLSVKLFYGHFETTTNEISIRMNRSEKIEFKRLAEICDDLSLNFEDAPEFMTDKIEFSFNLRDQLKRGDWSVKHPSLYSIKEIPVGNNIFGYGEGNTEFYVHYKVFVTLRGISSSMFQMSMVEYLFSKAMRPGLLMTIEFFHENNFLVFTQTISNRYIGFVQPKNLSQDEKYELIILQPDAATAKELFIGWSSTLLTENLAL